MLKSFIFLTLLSMFILNCTKMVYVDSRHVIDNQYDSEFPNVPTSDYLEEINNSVKLVNIMVRYHVYDIPLEEKLTTKNFDEDIIKDIAVKESYVNSPASGTATIIYNNNHRVALMSCAHIFNFPDTIAVNYLDDQGKVTPYVQSVYFKLEQNITIPGLPEISDFQVLVSDFKKDIAVIGKNYKNVKMIGNTTIRYPRGKASELKPGTFVFLFGFPRGIQMVSKAIVGHPNKDAKHNFIIDAAVHSGISGGPVFALRDGAPNFELVGMVFATAGEMLQFLGPGDIHSYDSNKKNKYHGDIYLKSTRQVVYGITYVISIESIEDFFSDNYDAFMSKGYNSKLFLTQKNILNKN